MSNPDQRYVEVPADEVERLRRHVAAAMDRKGFHKQADLAEASGLSKPTVKQLMDPTPGRIWRSSARAASTALGWTSDSIERILAGGDPEETDAPAMNDLAADVAEIKQRLTSLETMFREWLLRK